LYFFSILRRNLSKLVTQTGLYCSKQLETTFNQFGKKKSLHIIFKAVNNGWNYYRCWHLVTKLRQLPISIREMITVYVFVC